MAQQPFDVIQFLLRAEAFPAPAAQFLLQVLGPLAFHFLWHLHIGAVVGPGSALAHLPAKRIAPFPQTAAALLAIAPAALLIALSVL